MTDSTDNVTDDESEPTEASTAGRDVPKDATWEIAVQKPVDGDSPGGLTTTIVYAVAEAEDVRPVDVKNPPLYRVVDTAALEDAFFGPDDDVRSTAGQSTTEFMYRDHRVVVRSDGWVFVYDRVDD